MSIKNFFLIFFALFIIDQYIKFVFVDGFEAHSSCISLILAYNYGVAFSMFEFLAESLKYIQIALLVGVAIYLYKKPEIFQIYHLPASFIFAGGVSNILDRFVHGGVVDYVYWHCGFDFAIFNLADVLIDIGVVWILWLNYKIEKENTHLE